MASYEWFYRLAPFRNIVSPRWCAEHSRQEYWREAQKAIHRGAWFHDAGFVIGIHGDKSWAEWIMNRVEPGTSMDCMGPLCHSADAMRFIANQDVGDDADRWIEWWRQNRSKSQANWVGDGFRLAGIRVQSPPSADDAVALLEVLGAPETEAPAPLPHYLKFNAFRCLRDSEFEPVAFAIAEQSLSSDVKRGLTEYERLHRLWPATQGGDLSAAIFTYAESDDVAPPLILTRRLQFGYIACIAACFILSMGLVACSFRNKATK